MRESSEPAGAGAAANAIPRGIAFLRTNSGASLRLRWALVFVAIFWGLLDPYNSTLVYHGDVTQNDPADQTQIYTRLLAMPSIWNTGKYFVGTWVQGPETNYYRPLPCVLWWLAIHSPLNSLIGLMVLHWATHIVTCVVAVLFLRHLFGLNFALLGVAVWASGAGELLGLASAQPALYMWKDNVDTWFAVAALTFLWSFLSAIRTGALKYRISTFALLLICILIKEMSYMLPLCATLLLWHEGKLKTQWTKVVPYFGIVLLAVVYRTIVLHGMGTKLGTNGSWLVRFMEWAGGGRPLFSFFILDFVPLGAALVLSAFVLVKKSWRLATVVAILGLACIAMTDFTAGCENYGDAFLRLLPVTEWSKAATYHVTLQTFVLGWFWIFTVTHWDRLPRLAYLWFVVTYLPLFFFVVQSHGLYFPGLGWGILMAMPLIEGLRKLADSALGAAPAFTAP